MASVSIAEYEKALKALEEAIRFHGSAAQGTSKEIARDGTIQRFEFSIELATKVAAKHMGSGSTAPKQIVREMAQNGLIPDPQPWFDFIDARNLTSHSYDENIAKQVLEVAGRFLPEGMRLLKVLKTK